MGFIKQAIKCLQYPVVYLVDSKPVAVLGITAVSQITSIRCVSVIPSVYRVY